ncbi:Prophage CP4-57 regulatory protein (AlpA) [compost metagenome]
MNELTSEPTPQTNEVCAFMSVDEVLLRIGVSKTTLQDWCQLGYFPSPVQLGLMRSNGRPSKVGYIRAEVEAWVCEKAAQSRVSYRAQRVAPKSQAQPA